MEARYSVIDETTSELQSIPNGVYDILPIDKVAFGPGTVDTLPDEISRLSCERVLLIVDREPRETPALSRVEALLGSRLGDECAVPEEHVPVDCIVECARAIARVEADIVVAIGGSGAMNASKAAVLAAARDLGHFVPQIALPVTPSGQEFSPRFYAVDPTARREAGGASPFVSPSVVILDTELTDDVPDSVWYSGAIRALEQAVETVYAPNHQPATDATSLEAIRLLTLHLSTSTADHGARSAARQQCLVAGWLSAFGAANITLGLSRGISTEIATRYDLPYGQVAAAILPHAVAYVLPETDIQLAQVARAMGVERGGRADGELALEVPGRITGIMNVIGMPTRLRDLGVPQKDLTLLSAGRSDVDRILGQAW